MSNNAETPLLQVAAAGWYQDATDPRCPHDGWLQRFDFAIVGQSADEAACKRNLQIDVLNAYQTGTITFQYRDVVAYDIVLKMNKRIGKVTRRHDWLKDRVEVVERNLIRHVIEWEIEQWIIIAREITYSWIPNS